MKRKHKKLAPFDLDFASATTGGIDVVVAREAAFATKTKAEKIAVFKQYFIVFCKYFSLFLTFLLLCNAKIGGNIAPFAIGMVFALILVGQKAYVVGPIFVVASVLVNFSFEGFLIALCVFCSIMAMHILFVLVKKQTPIWCATLFQILGMAGHVYFNVGTRVEILQTVAFVVLSVLFLYICYGFLRAVLKRGLVGGLALDETICFGLILMAACLGLFDVYVWKFSVATIVVCFAMLFIGKAMGARYALYFCAIAGLGLAFANNSLNSLAIFCAWAVVVAALGNVNRYAVAIGVFVIDFLLGAYFHGYAIYTWVRAVEVLVPGLVFCLLPKRMFEKIGNKVEIGKGAGGLLFLDRDRERVRKRILELSKILENMGETYWRIGQTGNGAVQPKEQIANDVVCRLCKNCEHYARCMREKNMFGDILELSRAGIEKNKASLVDVTKNIAMHCTKTTSLLSAVNFAVASFAKVEKMLESEDQSRIAIGDQLVGTSKILFEASRELEGSCLQSADTAKVLAEELLTRDIVCKDLVVVERDDRVVVTMVVAAKEKEEEIAKAMEEFFGFSFVFSSKVAKQMGAKLLEFVPAPKFDLSVGVATEQKSQGVESGDVFAFVELDNQKVLLVICDGMGSGTAARNASEEVVGLVENFYRAGFESELILRNVSRLLATSGREVFSTLDVCVFDKKTGNVDFVKASSPPTAIKSGQTTSLICTESLPIGIVDAELRHGTMRLLKKGDVVVLASDGVFDAFASDEEFLETVNEQSGINMNLFCANLLEEAKQRGGAGKDDMTVVAFRVV